MKKVENKKLSFYSSNLLSLVFISLWTELTSISYTLFENEYDIIFNVGWLALFLAFLFFLVSLRKVVMEKKVNWIFGVNLLLLVYPLYLVFELTKAYLTFTRLY